MPLAGGAAWSVADMPGVTLGEHHVKSRLCVSVLMSFPKQPNLRYTVSMKHTNATDTNNAVDCSPDCSLKLTANQ